KFEMFGVASQERPRGAMRVRDCRAAGPTTVRRASAGCAHTCAPAPAPNHEVDDLSRRLFESQAREAELQRKIDELNNRLFILQDQLEARAVHATEKAPPRLPVAANADTDEQGDVEHRGAARDTIAPRPAL